MGYPYQTLLRGFRSDVDFRVDDKSRPRTMSFVGSEDYIRAQFEEYILALLSSVKYDNYLQQHSLPTQEVILPEIGSQPNPTQPPRSRVWRLTLP